jgi:hypothetical protein
MKAGVHWEDLSVVWLIMIKWVLKKQVGKIGLDLCGSGRGSLDPQ